MIVAFRRHRLLPLDDCLHALQPSIPGLTRSSLHRCLQRHGISRLPDLEGDKPAKKKSKSYPIGFFHMERAMVRHRSEDRGERRGAHGRGHAPPSSSPSTGPRSPPWRGSATRPPDGPRARSWAPGPGRQVLEEVLIVVPHGLHTILTDDGIRFAGQPRDRDTILSRMSRFDMTCERLC